jgi:mannitol/fructose-specific phosphotransferase system IIA component (Ntr-type)
MLPRGEVALIIAGIGLSTGILEQQSFGIAVLMTLLTTVIAPPLLNRLLDERPGTRREVKLQEKVTLPYDFASTELTDLLETRVLQHFSHEGYYIHTLESNNHKLFHIRMERSFITLIREEQSLIFKVAADDVAFVRTMIVESLINLHHVIDKIKNQAEPAQLRQQLATEQRGKPFDLASHLDVRCIEMDLTATSKRAIVEELVGLLERHGKLGDKQEVVRAVLEREESMSTGMQHGVALPHAKSAGVKRLTIAIGFKHEGIDFKSLDGQPARVFIMIISPLAVIGPHIQCLASIGALLNDVQAVQQLLVCRNEREVYSFFTGKKPSRLRAVLRSRRQS